MASERTKAGVWMLEAERSPEYGRFRDKKCGTNEQFYECGSACEPKCNEPADQVCTMQCIVDVCQCKPGYKRGPNGCQKPGAGCN
ncbi:trypsin Inhibitor like cysteine rich domain protein [Ancylostoma duodenale]|uniref:Trypsin Inhibitor like cysteine rich domain protein n=1 Tax=Ancylostoma duodenale TaxID=51022 RepID=A0A0C2GDB7_9BILA|nr:trypsin Inhibitor like cysteine rich domain protein [Ancylostoma duodenale]